MKRLDREQLIAVSTFALDLTKALDEVVDAETLEEFLERTDRIIQRTKAEQETMKKALD